ncbi:LacI family DNA-binding transcriptional regulator [Parashewanella curva]|uniref:LacI family DNA-binding transcriptional regulator n=1 Tax=Parashewanella curva TaxID=2338552 RepID=A0A3L8PZW0_9GAMM|nr:LacI family DNA-binding transcriptional regulator [Parashewanella curva]RLV60914.1 LacI family DNA-binding transcriptional regulator [Parashewanella curva]
MVTIKDVAKAAGVSVATVSRVVNNGPKVSDKKREEIKKIMADLGYRPNANARALVSQKSTTIGVVVPDISDPFFAVLANGIDKVAREHNMQILLSTGGHTAESERQAINLLLERRCDTIVMHSKKLPAEELVGFSKAVKGFVVIDRYIKAIAERCIWLDNLEGGRIAGRHLLMLNHQNCACIMSNFAIDDPVHRHNGFKEVLEASGVALAPELVKYAEPNPQGGKLAAQELLASGKPFSAIFVYNDAMAIGVVTTLEDNGFRVPQDVSVIGFDNGILAQFSRPKLTTLDYPVEEMAQHAAKLSMALAAKDQTPPKQEQKYVPLLVKRESAARM